MIRSAIILAFVLACCESINSQENPGGVSVDEGITIRRVFVPESELQKVIKGRYLPMKLERLNELLNQSRSRVSESQFSSTHFMLRWEPTQGLTGICRMQFDQKLSGGQNSFDSNLHFSRLRCLDSKFAFASVGRMLNGKQTLTAVSGRQFEAQVELPVDHSSRTFDLELPASKHQTIFVQVPVGYRLLTNESTQVVATVPESARIEGTTYLITNTSHKLRLSFYNESESSALVTSEDSLIWLKNRIQWSAELSMPVDVLAANDFEFWVDNSMQCTSISNEGKDIDFVVTEFENGLTRLKLIANEFANGELLLKLNFESPIRNSGSIQFVPLRLGKRGLLRSELIVQPSLYWRVENLRLDGFEVASISRLDGLRLTQVKMNGQVEVFTQRRNPEPVTQRLELDYQNGELQVRQLIDRVESQSVFRMDRAWSVSSVIDVQQDELPVPFANKRNSKEQLLIVENESESIWIVASRKLDLLASYALNELIPVQQGLKETQIVLNSGFINRFEESLRKSSGVPVAESQVNGDVFKLDDFNFVQFQLTSDNQKFQADLKTVVEIDLTQTDRPVRYLISWDVQKNRQIIVELGSSKVSRVRFNGLTRGAYKPLTNAEKRRLELPLNRSYWSFEMPLDSSVDEGSVSFVLEQNSKGQKSFNVPLPQSIGVGQTNGLIRVSAPGKYGFRIEGESLVEIPESANKRLRSFQFTKEREIQIVMDEPKMPDIEFQVLDCKATFLDQYQVLQKMHLTYRGQATDGNPYVFRFSSEGGTIKKVVFHQAGLHYSGVPSNSGGSNQEWLVTVPQHADQLVHAKVEIAVSKYSGWDLRPLSIPGITINSRDVKHACEAVTTNNNVFVDFKKVFSNDIQENIRNFAWLPSLGFDTATVDQYLGVEPKARTTYLGRASSESAIVLLPQKVLTVLALVILVLFAIVALALARNLIVVLLCLVFLVLTFVFGGVYGLMVSMAFWGTAIGLLVRELRRLCSFSDTRSQRPDIELSGISRSAILLAVVFLGGELSAQDSVAQPAEKPSESPGKRLIPAMIPVGDDEQPLGIAYLPAEIYELLTRAKTAASSIVCENAELEIRPATDVRSFSAALKMEIVTDGPELLELPFSIPGAIFDSEAITIDSAPVSFRPNQSKGTVEIEIERPGRQAIQVDFQVSLESREKLSIKVPFAGFVSVVNRSSIPFVLENQFSGESRSSWSAIIRANDKKLINSKSGLILTAGDPAKNELTVVETLDFSTSPARRRLSIFGESPFEKTLEFELDSQSVPVNPSSDLSKRGDVFSLNAIGQGQVLLRFNEPAELNPGALVNSVFLCKSHRIAKHFLLLQGTDRFQILHDWNQATSEQVAQINTLSRVVDPMAVGDFDLALSAGGKSAIRLWAVPKSTKLNCLATHHYFVSGRIVSVKSEFDVSCETPVSVVRFQLPEKLKDVEFSLGGSQLEWVRSGAEEVSLFVDLRQAGRYLIEMTGAFQIKSDKISFEETRFVSAASQSNSYFWTDRQRHIVDPIPKEISIASPRKGFVLAGTLKEGTQELSTRRNQEFEKISFEEDVRFGPGKTTHRLRVTLPENRKGQWMGIELPGTATITEKERTALTDQYGAIIDQTNVLEVFQIWLPLNHSEQSVLEIEYSQPLEGNQLSFAGAFNSKIIDRRVKLPAKINENKLKWDLGEARKISADDRIIEWDDPRRTSLARYEVQPQAVNPLQVHLAEVSFDEKSNRLMSRFFLSPGDQTTLSFEVSDDQQTESIRVCGHSREWSRTNENRLQIQLMNSRFVQVVDVVSYVAWDKRKRLALLRIPSIRLANEYPVYFQSKGQMRPIQAQSFDYRTLVGKRNNLVETAIDNYELNLENAESWRGVLKSWVDSVMDKEDLSEAVRARLDGLPASQVFDLNYAELESEDWKSGKTIYLLESNDVELVVPTNSPDEAQRFQLLLAVFALAVGALAVGRLPYGFRTPVLSILLACIMWVFGVAWIAITPESIFAWCWQVFALLFIALTMIDTVVKIRAYTVRSTPQRATGGDAGVQSTQMEESNPTI